MRESIEGFDSVIKQQESKERKKKGFVSLEIGAGGSQSPFIQDRNIEDYRKAHIIRIDLWAGYENQEERREMEQKYGGFGGSGWLLQAKERDEKQIKKLGKKFDGTIDYIKCAAEQLPLKDRSVDEIFIANVFSAPGFRRQKENKEKIIREAARVLKNNGELIIAETYTPQCALQGVDRDSKRTVFEKALNKFANEFISYGFKIKSIEFPQYSQLAYDKKERGAPCDEYLTKYPYGKKLFDKDFIPSPPAPNPDYKFIIVLTKQ